VGIELAFDGGSHRIDFSGLVGASVWLYPQSDMFIDWRRPVTATAARCATESSGLR
jgi:p-hydroxybenzoate 3-monooxygenase